MATAKSKKVKGELRSEVESEPVRYSLNVGRLVIDPEDNLVVQLEHGGFGKMRSRGLAVERAGERRASPFSHPYYLDREDHAEQVRRIDEFIEQNPHVATNPRIGLRKFTGADTPPTGAWDEMGAEQVYGFMNGTGQDLKAAMKYELNRHDSLGGPREDVIEVLERINEEDKIAGVDDAGVEVEF